MAGTSLEINPALLAQIEKEVKELRQALQDIKGVLTNVALAMPITFDAPAIFGGMADGTDVTIRYPGVTFKGYSGGDTYARKPKFGTAHAGSNVISTVGNTAQDCALGEPDGIEARFVAPQKQVYVWARPIALPGSGFGATSKDTPYLRAYDANGHILAESTYPLNLLSTQNPPWQQLICTSGSTDIVSVLFSCTVNQGGTTMVAYFDDFAFFR